MLEAIPAPLDLRLGDCLTVLRTLPDASIDAVVTDPPYELGFMGKGWDASGIAFNTEVWRECLRVLKPGGYLLAFGGTRTYHRMTVAIEDAGFEVRDCLMWVYGSGFPKSLNVEKNVPPEHAAAWAGWGTALKPAWEPVVVARKPLEGTVAGNVLKHGTGAMNIDGCRVPSSDGYEKAWDRPVSTNIGAQGGAYITTGDQHTVDLSSHKPEGGRWPANVILSHAPDCGEDGCAPGCPCAAMDAQSGVRKSGRLVLEPGKGVGAASENVYQGGWGDTRREDRPASEGGASRFFNRLPIEADDLVPFFYAAKASRSEREEGLNAGNMLCACEATRAEWDAEDRAASTLAETGTQRKRAITASTPEDASAWHTTLSGSDTTGASPKGSTFITSTRTSRTTGSKTLRSSPESSTSASIPGATSATACGGSPAASVESESLLIGSIGISPPKAGPSTDVAAPAMSASLSKRSVRVCPRCGGRDRKAGASDAVEREEGSAGMNSPRAGAGRTAKDGVWCSHPTVKPIAVMRHLVRLCCRTGGTVLDPFMGSGTTGVAAMRENVQFVGIEREPEYFAIAKARIMDVSAKTE
jgi:site-specific DNA-methyltransferase (adenine-specific)